MVAADELAESADPTVLAAALDGTSSGGRATRSSAVAICAFSGGRNRLRTAHAWFFGRCSRSCSWLEQSQVDPGPQGLRNIGVDRWAESQVGSDRVEVFGGESLDQVSTDLQPPALRRDSNVDDRDAVRVSGDREHAHESAVILEGTEPQVYGMRDVGRPSLQELSGHRFGQLADVHARQRLAQLASFQARDGRRLGFHGTDSRLAVYSTCATVCISI